MKEPSSIKIKIDSPCREKWDEMVPKANGKHCAACNKTVLDFRNKSDKEIYETFLNAGENICGRYYKHQLNRNIFAETRINKNIYPRILLSASLISSIFTAAFADNKSLETKTVSIIKSKNANEYPGPIFDKPDSLKYIEGKVLFVDYEEYANPNVIVKIRKSIIKTTTDSNGYFKLTIPERFCRKDSLEIEFGYEETTFQQITISTKNLPKTVNLYLKGETLEEEFMGFNTEAYIVGPYEGKIKKNKELKKKSFFRRNNK